MILANQAAGGVAGMVLWIVILIAFMYFFMIRPQKKEQQQKNAMLQALEIGDTVLTTSGFYGTIIDMSEDTVIIEFGNNKNCRIPMQRAAISAVEKPEDAAKAVGALVAKRALDAGISEVVFDRGGYVYHGRVAELAEAAREGGLKF